MSASLIVSTRLYMRADETRVEKAKMRSSYTVALPVPSKPSVSRKMVVMLWADHEASRLRAHTPLVCVSRLCPTVKPASQGSSMS